MTRMSLTTLPAAVAINLRLSQIVLNALQIPLRPYRAD